MGLLKELFDSININLGIKNNEDGTSDVSLNINSKPSKDHDKKMKEICDKIKNNRNRLANNTILVDTLLSEDTEVKKVSYDEAKNDPDWDGK